MPRPWISSRLRNLVLIVFLFYAVWFYFLFSGSTQRNDLVEANAHDRPKFQQKPPEPETPPQVFEFKLSNVKQSNTLNTTKISDNVFVAHAYLDQRQGNMGYPFVRFLLIVKGHRSVKCRFSNGDERTAKMYEMSENHRMAYGVFYANCEIPSPQAEVDVIEVSAGGEFVSINVNYIVPDERQTFTFESEYSLCVPSIFGDKYNGKHIVEFVELNKLLGVQIITIYGDSDRIQNEVKRTIDYYSDKGMIEFIDFRLPIDERSIWYHGQLVTITDCLVRNIGKSKYVGFHDLDEYLIPQEKTSTVEVLNELLVGKVGSLRVPTQYMGGNKGGNLPITLNTLQATSLDTLYTKCVLRPEMVFEQGIHHTSRVIQDNYESPTIDGKYLRLYHFKDKNTQNTHQRIPDVYGKDLLANYNRVVEELRL